MACEWNLTEALDYNGGMNTPEILAHLESLGDPKVREYNYRHGAGDKQYGVKLGDLRAIAKKVKVDHALGLELWNTGILDAMLLGILVMKPKQLTLIDLETMVRELTTAQLAEWFSSYVLKVHPERESLREKWMNSDNAMTARMGWSLTASRIGKDPGGLDIVALLDRLEAEMGTAPEAAQWTMNYALAEIGINFPELRERAIAIGEELGVYRDYPTSKGCTSPFAPTWIREMVARQN